MKKLCEVCNQVLTNTIICESCFDIVLIRKIEESANPLKTKEKKR